MFLALIVALSMPEPTYITITINKPTIEHQITINGIPAQSGQDISVLDKTVYLEILYNSGTMGWQKTSVIINDAVPGYHYEFDVTLKQTWWCVVPIGDYHE